MVEKKLENLVEISLILRGNQDGLQMRIALKLQHSHAVKHEQEQSCLRFFLLSDPEWLVLKITPFLFFQEILKLSTSQNLKVWPMTVRYLSGAGSGWWWDNNNPWLFGNYHGLLISNPQNSNIKKQNIWNFWIFLYHTKEQSELLFNLKFEQFLRP